MRKKYLIITIIYIVLLIPVFVNNSNVDEEVNYTAELNDPIVIELEGAVAYPGIYTFYQPIYLEELLKSAGNYTKDADQSKINFFDLLTKSKKVVIPSLETNENSNIVTLVDLNKASFNELIKVPNITETRAANIIIYRVEQGRFNDIEELKNVKGIGDVTYEKIYKFFKVD